MSGHGDNIQHRDIHRPHEAQTIRASLNVDPLPDLIAVSGRAVLVMVRNGLSAR